MMFAYSLLLGVGLTVSAPWWLFRMATTSRYRRGLRQRLGRVPSAVRAAAAGHRIIWLHAVSVGEVLAATQLVHALELTLNGDGDTPPWRVMISTTTETGQRLARERFGAHRVFRFPLDFAWAVRAWLQALQPRLVLLVESELWPRMLEECAHLGIPVAVVNARMSDRSFRRARRFRRLWRSTLLKVPLFLASSAETAERLHALGVPQRALATTGNLKYDIAPRETAITGILRPLVERHLLVVAGSLVAPEEDEVLAQWSRVHQAAPPAVLLLAPRHPERFAAVAEQAAAHGKVLRATELLQGVGQAQALRHLPAGAIVLLDTVGDLAAVYGLAEIAFVGGSLAPRGGHNPLEPARFGVPVLIGPSFENFRDIVSAMQRAHGIEIVASATELGDLLIRLLKDRVAADALGQRGQGVFRTESGATDRTVRALLPLLHPEPAPAGAAR